MKAEKTIKINGKACKVLSLKHEDYQMPAYEWTLSGKTTVHYACTIRRHIFRVKMSDGQEKIVTVDPYFPARPDALDIISIEALKIDPAQQPAGLSSVRCAGGKFLQARMIIEDAPPEIEPEGTRELTIAAAWVGSRMKPGKKPTDTLFEAYAKEREKHATEQDTFKALAEMDIATARENGNGLGGQFEIKNRRALKSRRTFPGHFGNCFRQSAL